MPKELESLESKENLDPATPIKTKSLRKRTLSKSQLDKKKPRQVETQVDNLRINVFRVKKAQLTVFEVYKEAHKLLEQNATWSIITTLLAKSSTKIFTVLFAGKKPNEVMLLLALENGEMLDVSKFIKFYCLRSRATHHGAGKATNKTIAKLRQNCNRNYYVRLNDIRYVIAHLVKYKYPESVVFQTPYQHEVIGYEHTSNNFNDFNYAKNENSASRFSVYYKYLPSGEVRTRKDAYNINESFYLPIPDECTEILPARKANRNKPTTRDKPKGYSPRNIRQRKQKARTNDNNDQRAKPAQSPGKDNESTGLCRNSAGRVAPIKAKRTNKRK